MRVIRNNIATIVCGLAVVAVLAGVTWYFWLGGASMRGALVAVIHDGDGQTYELSLNRDARLEVATGLGTNTIVVEDGAVRMEQANCPKGDCLRQAAISRPGQQVICLPHRLWVEVVREGGGDQGAVGDMDVDAVTWSDEHDVDLVAR